MSQPPQGEDPQQDGRAQPGWGPPSGQYGGGYGQQGGQGQPGGHGGQYGQPGQGGWGPPSQYGAPGQYGAPAGYGQPGQYGSPHGQPYGPPAQYGQPGQYGAPPGWGQPYGQYGGWEQPPPPARRGRRFGLLFGLLVLALLIGLAFTLPARLAGTRLDPEAVQRDVAAQYEQREGVALELSCDQTMTVEDGRTYECDGTTADGDPVTITLTLSGTDGDYTWSDS
ncbi:DUF4333 domain-containing protein [Modestobacter altitudinis]|uniref:DUF4333 domain-containing protein n=1 Tax=Modestobacter altitudinis TaxID=2213158 RepID=UPI00110D104D|nr:DUF4333 domain-containing protein [Modestobacter altitudinis]